MHENERITNVDSNTIFNGSMLQKGVSPKYVILTPWQMYVLKRAYTPDPAARYIPFHGKIVWTLGVIFACTSVMFLTCVLGDGIVSLKDNPMLGPSTDLLRVLGGLNTHDLRRGQWWRLFWAPFLHAGWFHAALNLIILYFIGLIIEPDWGFLRTSFVFMLSAVTGMLMSATLSPNSSQLEEKQISVGASGGIFGLMAACIPYIFEYWDTIQEPYRICRIVTISLFVGLLSGCFPFIDNYAHIGGTIGGILGGFLTISRLNCSSFNYKRESKCVMPLSTVRQNCSSPSSFQQTAPNDIENVLETKCLSKHNEETLHRRESITEKMTDTPSILSVFKKNVGNVQFPTDTISSPSNSVSDASFFNMMSECFLPLNVSTIHTTSTCVSGANSAYQCFEVKPEEKAIPMIIGNVSLMSSKLKQECHDKNLNNVSKKHKHFIKCWIFEKLYNLLFKKARHSCKSSYEEFIQFPTRMTFRFTQTTYIDDSFVWNSRVVWSVRICSASCLISVLLVLISLLYCPSCYDPPGKFSFISIKAFS